jgi:hypothetical protein
MLQYKRTPFSDEITNHAQHTPSFTLVSAKSWRDTLLLATLVRAIASLPPPPRNTVNITFAGVDRLIDTSQVEAALQRGVRVTCIARAIAPQHAQSMVLQ